MSENGKVKWFSNVKGYGFLEKEGGEKDIFVHYSAILSDGYRRLDSGEEVTFEIVEGEKGPQARNVIRTKKPPKEKPGKAEPAAPAAEKPAEAAASAESEKPVPPKEAKEEKKEEKSQAKPAESASPPKEEKASDKPEEKPSAPKTESPEKKD